MCIVDTEDLFLLLQTISVCLSVYLSGVFAWSIGLKSAWSISTEYKGQGSKNK